MTQLAILEGETLGKLKLKKIIRKTGNLAKKTVSPIPLKPVAGFIKRQVLDNANGVIRRNVTKLATRFISPDKLISASTKSLVGSLQPIIQPPIISALTLIPGAQTILPIAPSLILGASYKAVDDLKKKALKKTNLAGNFVLDKNKNVLIIIGGLMAYLLLKKGK